MNAYLYNVRQGIQEIYEFSEAIISYTTLATKVMVVCWNEAIKQQLAVWGSLQEINKLSAE